MAIGRHHPVSVRLDKTLEARVRRHVSARGVTLAHFVRQAIDEKLAGMRAAREKRTAGAKGRAEKRAKRRQRP
jgi:predicted DNA-binding protein